MNEQKRIEREAEKMMSRMLSNLLLESENTPEVHRNVIMLLDRGQDVADEIQKLVDSVANNALKMSKEERDEETDPEAKQLSERAKKIIEYFDLMLCGIQQFASTLNEED